jgi:serine/threonine protein kinase
MENSIIGTEVEGYQIQEILGRGGMGVVYGAEDIALSRAVALKRIAPSLANDESFLRRFRSEAQALARIDSPHIVSVHALRQTEIGLLIVMEYVEGGTLEDLTLEGPMDWQEALPLVKQMLTALEHAHGEEVIHRDIKPQNVMLGVEKTVKVTDFGLAKVHRGDSKATVTQGVHGTLDYMSPEQVKGSADLDHRSDLYSLSMTVYEMLAGELPFDEDGDEFAQMRTIVEEELPRPDELNPEVPEEISALVMTALEKDPDERFQSATEMREAFEVFEENRREPATQEFPTQDLPPSASQTTSLEEETPASEYGNQRMIVGGLAAVALLLAGVNLWLVAAGDEPSSSRTQLSVSSEPSGARMFLNGDRTGTTPLSDTTIEENSARIQVKRAGYVPTDTVVRLEGKSEVDLELPLTRKSSSLSIQTTPEAQVSLDGEEIGRAPVTRDVREDTIEIHAERQGYYPVDTVVSPVQTERVQLSLRLKRRPRPSAPNDFPESSPPDNRSKSSESKPEGTLTLDSSHSGTVYVDGERRPAEQPIRVTAEESHQIRIQHPSRGACDTTLAVEAGGGKALTCYFDYEVRVPKGLDEPWANVYIEGKNTGQQTPYDTLLAAGKTYEIGARIQRDPGITVSGGTYRAYWEERDSTEGPNRFTGRSTTITLRPSFKQTAHIIDFQVRSEP